MKLENGKKKLNLLVVTGGLENELGTGHLRRTLTLILKFVRCEQIAWKVSVFCLNNASSAYLRAIWEKVSFPQSTVQFLNGLEDIVENPNLTVIDCLDPPRGVFARLSHEFGLSSTIVIDSDVVPPARNHVTLNFLRGKNTVFELSHFPHGFMKAAPIASEYDNTSRSILKHTRTAAVYFGGDEALYNANNIENAVNLLHEVGFFVGPEVRLIFPSVVRKARIEEIIFNLTAEISDCKIKVDYIDNFDKFKSICLHGTSATVCSPSLFGVELFLMGRRDVIFFPVHKHQVEIVQRLGKIAERWPVNDVASFDWTRIFCEEPNPYYLGKGVIWRSISLPPPYGQATFEKVIELVALSFNVHKTFEVPVVYEISGIEDLQFGIAVDALKSNPRVNFVEILKFDYYYDLTAQEWNEVASARISVRRADKTDLLNNLRVLTSGFKFKHNFIIDRPDADEMAGDWILNVFNGSFESDVFCIFDGQDVIGFFTVSLLAENECRIGLFGVSGSCRGKGLGRLCFYSALEALHNSGFKKVSISCFAENQKAAAVYSDSKFVHSRRVRRSILIGQKSRSYRS